MTYNEEYENLIRYSSPASSDRQALIKNAFNHYGESLPHLVLADHLEDAGSGAEEAMAHHIRDIVDETLTRAEKYPKASVQFSHAHVIHSDKEGVPHVTLLRNQDPTNVNVSVSYPLKHKDQLSNHIYEKDYSPEDAHALLTKLKDEDGANHAITKLHSIYPHLKEQG